MRTFCEHRKRSVQSLNGAWRFITDPNRIGEAEGFARGLVNSQHITVPSVWNTTHGLLDYEGVVWYEKEFYTEGGTLRFVFGAVMTEARVFLDGEPIGRHYGGFSEFELIISDVSDGKHRLTVRVDNSFDDKSIPQTMVDWYHYGGIVRGVSVEVLRGVCILSNRFEYILSSDMKSAICKPVLELYNAGRRVKKSKLSLSIDGKVLSEEQFEVRGGKSKTVTLPEFTIDGVELWNPGAPKLYTVYMESESDDLYDRVGFRMLEIKNKKLYINGEELEIRGINRHEEHPDFGFAFPASLMKRDIDLILDLGCNAIRGSHYPNSQYFIDLLDECGVLFWSEIPIWGGGFSDKALGDKTVLMRGLAMHREMIKYYYNHPSIIIFGMHNEINSNSKEAYKMSKLYYELLKANGGNRAVVYATCYPMEDICLEFCDIIALNKYIGWYDLKESWDKYLNDFKERKELLGISDKPIIMGEFGGAAIFAFHDEPCVVWSEEYQAAILTDALEKFKLDREVIGYFVWQFCDIRTNIELSINRARSFNNKGIMNEYRKPKLAYYAVRKKYREFKG